MPDRPPDEPGKGRSAALYLVGFLAVLLLAMPVAWAAGALASRGTAVGTAGAVLLWIVWAVILIAAAWAGLSMWRRAA